MKDKRFSMNDYLAFLLLGVAILFGLRNQIDPLLGTYLTAAATIFLGLVANNLNDRLLKVEEDSFIATHVCSGFIEEIEFDFQDEALDKVISIASSKNQALKTNSIELSEGRVNYIEMKIKVGTSGVSPSIIKANGIKIVMTNPFNYKDNSIFSFRNISGNYSKVAIFADHIKANILLLLNKDERDELKKLVHNQKYNLELEIDLSLASKEMVQSNFICRSNMKIQEFPIEVDQFAYLKADADNKMYFWQGNEFLEKDKILITNNYDS